MYFLNTIFSTSSTSNCSFEEVDILTSSSIIPKQKPLYGLEMINNEINDAEFIAEVQKYECIYDKTDICYTKTSPRNNAWQQIAEHFLTSGKNHRTYTNVLHIFLQHKRFM